MSNAVKFSKPKMIVEIAISTAIKLYCVYWFCLSAFGTNAKFPSRLRLMDFHVLASGHQLKVFYPVVCFVLIYVMDNFIREQKTSNMFFHYKDMNSHIFPVALCPWMPGRSDQDIIPVGGHTTFKSRKLPQRASAFYFGLIFSCFAVTYSTFRNFAARFDSVCHRVIIT